MIGRFLMRRACAVLTAVWLVLAAAAACAQAAAEGLLPVDGRIAEDGGAVSLDWFDTATPRIGSVAIDRRRLGETGAGTWRPLVAGLPGGMRYTDTTIAPGIAYEYRVSRHETDIVDIGYWAAGVAVPAPETPRMAYLVVDDSVAADLAAHLARFARDLTGAGWQVHRRDVPRGTGRAQEDLAQVVETKAWLRERHVADPPGTRAVILIGHVPVVRSGRAAPDGHDPVPHATDLIYGDVHGVWHLSPEGTLLDNRLPGDFIEMQVGRIDFAGLAPGDPALERHLLRHYFDKNHHWRMGLHGDLRVAYGQSPHLVAERHGLRNIVGAAAITAGGHHDAGERRPWLWGVDFGDWNGPAYATDYANRAVFTINFGSGKQHFERVQNPMTALLAQPFYPLTAGWGGRPAWWLHLMALGGTVGDVHMRTVNNGIAALPYRESMDYFPTGAYLWRNPVWVNLLGDPTLHAFVLAPPGAAAATHDAGEVTLSWRASPDPDATGYRVYRAEGPAAPFVEIGGPGALTQTTFTDPAPVAQGRYLIRAEGLKIVPAGSFVQRSQGVFVRPGTAPPDAPDIVLRARTDAPVAVPADFARPDAAGTIRAVIAPPATGTLAFGEAGWVYTPPPGFTGPVALRYAASNGGQTVTGDLTILVGE